MTVRPVPDPCSCTHCGQPKPHGWQWIESASLHMWAKPTDAQILARMHARRAARTAPSA